MCLVFDCFPSGTSCLTTYKQVWVNFLLLLGMCFRFPIFPSGFLPPTNNSEPRPVEHLQHLGPNSGWEAEQNLLMGSTGLSSQTSALPCHNFFHGYTGMVSIQPLYHHWFLHRPSPCWVHPFSSRTWWSQRAVTMYPRTGLSPAGRNSTFSLLDIYCL